LAKQLPLNSRPFSPFKAGFISLRVTNSRGAEKIKAYRRSPKKLFRSQTVNRNKPIKRKQTSAAHPGFVLSVSGGQFTGQPHLWIE
jgi:hypothetical protein